MDVKESYDMEDQSLGLMGSPLAIAISFHYGKYPYNQGPTNDFPNIGEASQRKIIEKYLSVDFLREHRPRHHVKYFATDKLRKHCKSLRKLQYASFVSNGGVYVPPSTIEKEKR